MKLPAWLKQFLKWLTALFAGELIELLIPLISLAYLSSKAVDPFRGVAIVFDSISPLFWPILAVLSLLVFVPRAYIIPFIKWRNRPSALRTEIEQAHKWLTYSHRVHTIPEDCEYYLPQIKQFAEDAIYSIIEKLPEEFKERFPFPSIDADDDASIALWYECIREIRPLIK